MPAAVNDVLRRCKRAAQRASAGGWRLQRGRVARSRQPVPRGAVDAAARRGGGSAAAEAGGGAARRGARALVLQRRAEPGRACGAALQPRVAARQAPSCSSEPDGAREPGAREPAEPLEEMAVNQHVRDAIAQLQTGAQELDLNSKVVRTVERRLLPRFWQPTRR
jgi:hypothetical protein